MTENKTADIMKSSFSKDEDIFIINHIYFDMSMYEIAVHVKRSLSNIYTHASYYFDRPISCKNHKSFQSWCPKCHKNWIIWNKNTIKQINDAKYKTRCKRTDYTPEMDTFIVEHAYSDMSFSQLEEHFHLPNNSIPMRILSFFGSSPKCSNHPTFDRRCLDCSANLVIWRQKCLEKINQHGYKDYEKRNQIFLQSVQDANAKKRRDHFIECTSKFRDIISEEIYDDAIDFMCEHDFCKGRVAEEIFIQISRTFIHNYLQILDFSEFIPINLLKFFFSARPNTDIIKIFMPSFKEEFNMYTPIMPSKLFALKDIVNSADIIGENNVIKLFQALYQFNQHFDQSLLVGNFGVLLYLYSKKTISQEYLSRLFGISDVTLRSRVKTIQKKYTKYMTDFFTVLNEIPELLSLFPKIEIIIGVKKN